MTIKQEVIVSKLKVVALIAVCLVSILTGERIIGLDQTSHWIKALGWILVIGVSPAILLWALFQRRDGRHTTDLIPAITPYSLPTQPDRLSVVPTSESPQRPGILPVLKIKVSLRGRPLGMYTFTKNVITVGRDPKSDIHLDNVNVAREHLRFEFGPSGYYTLVDLGTANGTFLNDEAVSRGYVYNNDVVRIGSYTLWIGFQVDTRHVIG